MKRQNIWSKVCVGTVMTFLYAPIIVLIIFSFNKSKSRALWTGFTFDWYRKLFTNDKILTAFGNTIIIAVISAVIATILGTFAAIGIFSMKKRTKSLILNITYMPILNPEIVTGVSLLLLFVSFQQLLVIVNNALGTNFNFEMGITSLVLAHISFSVPYVILNVIPKLRQQDKFVYEAALDLGCSPFEAFWKVVIPQIMPGIVSGMLMAFTFSLDDFIISYFVTGPKFQTLPIEIYSMTRKKVSPEINALSTVVFIVVLLVLTLSNYLDAKKEKQKATQY